jgi:hypothetical protein
MIDEIAQGIRQSKALKKQRLERHRHAFDLWFRLRFPATIGFSIYAPDLISSAELEGYRP